MMLAQGLSVYAQTVLANDETVPIYAKTVPMYAETVPVSAKKVHVYTKTVQSLHCNKLHERTGGSSVRVAMEKSVSVVQHTNEAVAECTVAQLLCCTQLTDLDYKHAKHW